MDSGEYLDTQDCKQCKYISRREVKINELKNLLEESEESYSALLTENDHLKGMCTSYRISERNLEKRFLQTEERIQSLNEQYTSLHEKKTKAFQELTKFKQILAVTKSENETLAAQNAQIQIELAMKCIDAKLFKEMRLYFAQKQMELSLNSSALKTLELERDHCIQHIIDLKAQLDEKEKLCSELINNQNIESLNQELLNSSDNLDSSCTVSSSVLGEENTLKNELDKCLGGYTLLQVNASLQTSFLLMDSSTQTAECLCSQCQVSDEEGHQHTFFLTTLHVTSVNETNVSNIDNCTQTEELPDSQHKERYRSSIYLSALSQDEASLPHRQVHTQHLEQRNLTVHCSDDNDVVEVESSANSKSLSVYSSSNYVSVSGTESVDGTRPPVPEDCSAKSEGRNFLSIKSSEIQACAGESNDHSRSENSALDPYQVLPSQLDSSDRTVSLCNSPGSDKYARSRLSSSLWRLKLISTSLLVFLIVILFMWVYLKMVAECRKCSESASCILHHVKRIFDVLITYPRGPPPV